MKRRTFLSWLTVGLTGVMAALVGVPILGYLLAPLFPPPPVQHVDVGAGDALRENETALVKFKDPSPLPWAGLTADTAIWVRRNAGAGSRAFTVFSIHCTHLGCPVNWLAGADLFLCPCHGGVFYSDGRVAAGPPARPLYQRDWKVENERLLVKNAPLPTPGSGTAS